MPQKIIIGHEIPTEVDEAQGSIDKVTQMDASDDVDISHSHPHPMLVSSGSEGGGQGPHGLGMLSGTFNKVGAEEGEVIHPMESEVTSSGEGLWRMRWSDYDYAELLQEMDILQSNIDLLHASSF